MLWGKLKKALYGTLQAALLFCRLLLDTQMEWGFKLNNYGKFVSSKTVKSVVEDIINNLEKNLRT